MKPHFTEEEANAILRRAIEKMPAKGAMSIDQIESIGAELGIPPEAIRKAEAERNPERGQRLVYSTFVANEEAGFRNHLYTFIGANAVLILINYLVSPDYWWCVYPLLVWGCGLVFHGVKVYDRDSQHHVTSFFQYLRLTPPADTDAANGEPPQE
jgi:hypothetical protein